MSTLLVLALTGPVTGLGSAAVAAQTARSTSNAPCNVSVTAGTGAVVHGLIVGVTAGSTKITFDCNAASGAGIAAEASILGGIGTFSLVPSGEADTSALATFAAAPSDTACPAGTAGSCVTATFLVPASFSATDARATCPPTQSEVNAGLFGCAVAVATTTLQPLAGAEYLITYASETTPPAAPTIAATVAEGPPGSTITVSDAAANTGYWWANAIQLSQAAALGVSAATVPTTCGSGGGYGSVPAPFLAVNWFASGSTTAITGSAAGVTISNDCYNGTALYGPALSGTITVPSTLSVGTTYTAYLCELDITPFPSNDPNVATDCGPSSPGTTWIDASFAFTASNGTPQTALSLTSVSGMLGTPLTLAISGGSGTGAVSYSVVNGTATGCTVTNGALSASSAGTCVVTATKASDSNDLAVSSTPTTVTLTALPVLTLVTTKVALASSAKTLPIKVSCSGAPCSGTLSVTAPVKVGKGSTAKTQTLSLGSAAFHLSAGSTASVVIHLGGTARAYLEGNPDRPILAGAVYATRAGKKSYLGRVSLLK